MLRGEWSMYACISGVLRAFIVGVMSWDSMHALLEFGIMHTR